MSTPTLIILGLGAAFCAGIFYAVAILFCKLPRRVRQFFETRRLRKLRIDDTWNTAPWRDM
ncbi:hypothetical protein [Rhizobium sp. S96]|uniref:hypothetical protein n=1 Tax=Rhizobium sp. S96 TaxID=3055140 RepID=UPI0025AADC15|nr:hypothetical protein [Rhizobium sp. S96]MDM9619103.1 hypothetical protein [Rhizobium sp. S96]